MPKPEPVFLNVNCSACQSTGCNGMPWPNNVCYHCAGTGKILRPYVLADSPWIATVNETD